MDIIKAPIDFNALVQNAELSVNFKSKILDELNKNFTEDEQRWYIANLFVYLHYHPTNDYPINLENVYKMIGFANKGNAKRTLENNFTAEEDYKSTFLPSEKGQIAREEIMLNIDTFKSLCMLVKTDKAKDIRKYYVKLENMYNKMINEEKREYEKNLENNRKLLEENKKELEEKEKLLIEKDKCIEQLKEKEIVSSLYIGHNPLIKNIHKIGINDRTDTSDILSRLENHKSSNPQFEYLFTYETKDAKKIESMVKILLKPFKLSKPEWFTINYDRMKQVVDFCIMMYDHYNISESVENLCEFIGRYRSNRLINSNKARVIINKNIYQEYVNENFIYGPQLKVSSNLICDDFYNWYRKKFPDKIDCTHIKLETGNWSTEFIKEMAKNISNITSLEYTNDISLSDQKRGIYFSKSAGFRGIELKSMIKVANYFDKQVYKQYVESFITITNNPKNKVARIEIVEDFLIWVKTNNFPSKNKLYCQKSVSSVFKQVLIEEIEEITELKLQDVNKINYNGCFIGMIHKNFDCNGNETSPRENLTDYEKIKKQIDKWIDIENNDIIAKIFREMLKNNYKLSNSIVKELYKTKQTTSYVTMPLNPKKNNWHLVFNKNEEFHYLLPDAITYIKELKT